RHGGDTTRGPLIYVAPGGLLKLHTQKNSLSPSCTMRLLLSLKKSAKDREPVISPNPGAVTLSCGLPKAGVLVALSASSRNSRLIPSRTRNLRNTEASRLKTPGPL